MSISPENLFAVAKAYNVARAEFNRLDALHETRESMAWSRADLISASLNFSSARAMLDDAIKEVGR